MGEGGRRWELRSWVYFVTPSFTRLCRLLNSLTNVSSLVFSFGELSLRDTVELDFFEFSEAPTMYRTDFLSFRFLVRKCLMLTFSSPPFFDNVSAVSVEQAPFLEFLSFEQNLLLLLSLIYASANHLRLGANIRLGKCYRAPARRVHTLQEKCVTVQQHDFLCKVSFVHFVLHPPFIMVYKIYNAVILFIVLFLPLQQLSIVCCWEVLFLLGSEKGTNAIFFG